MLPAASAKEALALANEAGTIDLLLTDAGKIVLEYARRFENLQGDLENAIAELRDKSAGRLTIGANESSTLYLLDHIEDYRRRYPKIRVQVRRSLSSKIPGELIDGELELGLLTYDPEDDRLIAKVIYTDHLVNGFADWSWALRFAT